MEHCEKGTLYDAYTKQDRNLCSWDKLLPIFYDLARGMKFLHDKNMVHRNLSLKNVMVGQNITFLITLNSFY